MKLIYQSFLLEVPSYPFRMLATVFHSPGCTEQFRGSHGKQCFKFFPHNILFQPDHILKIFLLKYSVENDLRISHYIAEVVASSLLFITVFINNYFFFINFNKYFCICGKFHSGDVIIYGITTSQKLLVFCLFPSLKG